MNKAQKIQGIDFIRIFSIMGIVIYHYVCHAPALQPYMLTFANNDYGVTFSHMFLIVSGFCLYYKYSDGQLNVVKFWKKRWLSIFPQFYFTYIILFIFQTIINGYWFRGIPVARFLLTLIGMDGFYLHACSNFYICGEWFLGAIIYMYLLFPLLRYVVNKVPFLTLIALIVATKYLNFPILGYDPTHNVVVSCLYFTIGLILAKYIDVIQNKWTIISCAVLSLIMFLVPIPIIRDLGFSLADLFIVVPFFIVLLRVGTWFDGTPVVTQGAALSYMIFLVHHVIIMEVLTHWNRPLIWQAVLVLFFCVILTVLCAKAFTILYNAFHEKYLKFS